MLRMESKSSMTLNELDELVAQYGARDEQIKSLKKVNDADKEILKEGLFNLNTAKWTSGGFTVQRIEATTETLNEAKVLKLLNDHRELANDLGLIKTMEYVDFEALESAIYQGVIPTDIVVDLDGCRESKTTVSLKCTKAKKES